MDGWIEQDKSKAINQEAIELTMQLTMDHMGE